MGCTAIGSATGLIAPLCVCMDGLQVCCVPWVSAGNEQASLVNGHKNVCTGWDTQGYDTHATSDLAKWSRLRPRFSVFL